MSPVALTRRAFLAAGGGVLLAAACGGSGGDGDAQDDHHAPIPQGKGLSALNLSADLYASPAPQRFAFALAEDGEYASGPPARITFGPDGGRPSRPLAATLYTEGLPQRRGIYVAQPAFSQPGVWLALVEVDGKRAELALQVAEQAATIVPGQAAPRVPSPTTADPLGTDPLCTREPDCGLHEVSVDLLLGAGRPVAVMFATPARCVSQYCGPVLDQMLTLVDRYRDRVDFVHVEIYRSDRGTETVPTVQAWSLPSEPWLFGVDAAGNVASRLDGAFGGEEIEQLVAGLTS
jgi:hypothetical protein